MQDDDLAAEEEKVLSGSTDANDVVVIKNLMKVRQSTLGSVCTQIVLGHCDKINCRFTEITPVVRLSQR